MLLRTVLPRGLVTLLVSLVVFVGLLAGHCPRPVLDPHHARASVTASEPALVASGSVITPTDHTCVTQIPSVIEPTEASATSSPLLGIESSCIRGSVMDPTSVGTAPSRGPPAAGHPVSLLELRVLRV